MPETQRNYQNVQQPQQRLIEEAERQRLAKQMNYDLNRHRPSSRTEQQQQHRRSVPNLLMETNTQILTPNNYQNVTSSNYQNMNSSNYQNSSQFLKPSVSSSAMTKIYQKQRKSGSPSRHQPKYLLHGTTPSGPNPFIAKPPSNPRQMSTSQYDLKNTSTSSKQLKHSSNGHHNYHNQKLSTSTSSLAPSPGSTKGSAPIISLNQKCSCCTKMLGQGSAMFIEKLGLAFHLKCFRCSVCNVPLGNGKEGTDVRVSVTNRLHCNNCFSNDLGVRLSAV